ncbi:MAG: hypothetical protein QNI90_00680 [Dinoroseobacter sp.]|nr:hypothetical protein [Dinoroseobacter sp.]MDJ0992063.1 hypothetical protein [Dinoroseobacter sp.]
MPHPHDPSIIAKVLSLPEDEVSEFVRQAMSSKRLSGIVKDLNSNVLYGEPDQKAQATEALGRLGFTI